MLSSGVRLALLVAVPLFAALLVHELGERRRLASACAVAALAAITGLALSVAGAVTAGRSVERTVGTAIPGADITFRADSVSIAVMLVATLAAAAALPRASAEPGRLAGLLLTLAGTAALATAGTLVQTAAAVEVIALGGLLLDRRGSRRLPGLRSAAVITALIAGSGLSLLSAAVQLVSAAGSSDLAFLPATAVGAAIAVPWALAGAALLVAPTLLGQTPRGTVDWPALATVPAGFLVLLRLQQTAGGQLPGAAQLTLEVIGAVMAVAGGLAALRARSVEAAARAALTVVAGFLVSAFAGQLGRDGTVLAGLFLALELGWLAAPSWTRRPTAWSASSAALLVLPGGLGGAVALVSLGSLVSAGPPAFAQLVALTLALAAAGVGVTRQLLAPPRAWRPAPVGAILAVLAGLAGGLLPGTALHDLAPPLAGGAAALDLDAGTLAAGGSAWPGGYLAIALVFVVVAGAAALLVLREDTVAPLMPAPVMLAAPRLAPLLRFRRRTRKPQARLASIVRSLDRWLETQPQVAAVVIGAALAIAVLR